MNSSDVQIMVVAGEPSGDLHAGRLLEALSGEMPNAHVFGVGGEVMRKAGAEILHDCGPLAAVGIGDFPRVLPILRQIKKDLLEQIRQRRPQAVILVDYPGFNLSLAKGIRNLPESPPLIYFIPPQVWAWGTGRARTIASLFDLILTIYPFEPKYFTQNGGKAEFIGNPVSFGLRDCPSREEARASLGIPPEAKVFSFLPGSRGKEITRHVPPMKEAAQRLQERWPDAVFLLSEAEGLPEGTVQKSLSSPAGLFRVVRGRQHEVIRAADTAVVVSGTATLETGLLGTPMIVIFLIEWPTYLVGRYLLMQVDFMSLVNLIADREVAPELHQGQANPKRIADLVSQLMEDFEARERQIRGFEKVREFLAGPDPYAHAAGRIRVYLESVQ
jgi:lipid-A-disaccharide synthase